MLVVVVVVTIDGMIQQQPSKVVVLAPDELAKLDVVPLEDKLDKALVHDEAGALGNALNVLDGRADDGREKGGELGGGGGIVEGGQVGEDGGDALDGKRGADAVFAVLAGPDVGEDYEGAVLQTLRVDVVDGGCGCGGGRTAPGFFGRGPHMVEVELEGGRSVVGNEMAVEVSNKVVAQAVSGRGDLLG